MPVRGIQDLPSEPQGQPQQQGGGLLGGPGGDELYPPMNKFLVPEFKMQSFIFVVSVVQVVMFITELIVGATMFDGAFIVSNNMAGPGSEAMRYLGAKYLPDIKDGQIWRFWTPALLHGGILHIFMNGVFQCMLCYRYENRWGTGRIAYFYFMTAFGATLFSCVSSPFSVSVGASGALFGMLGCQVSWILMNWNDIPMPHMQLCNIICIVLMNILIGMGWSSGNIDNAAHMGGLITGILVGVAFVSGHSQFQHEYLVGREVLFKRVGLFLCLIWYCTLLSVTFYVV